MTCVRVQLRIRLLEDMHTGSGLGRGSVDAAQARDRDGRPVIWWSHLKGVLRATAEALCERGDQAVDPAALFGWDSRSAGDLKSGVATVSSAYLDEQNSPTRERWFLRWSSTARAINSRQPLEDSKRTDEYIAAGCEFVSNCEVPEEYVATFAKVAEATARLGAKRSRGALVRIDCQRSDSAGRVIDQGSKTSCCLRLLLRARDPLAFPTTPVASNIVDSQHFIPGSALLGAVVKDILQPNEDPAKDPLVTKLLDDRTIHIGNGYPLPPHWPSDHLSTLELLPAPLSYRLPKGSAKTASVPAWAMPAASEIKYLDAKQDQLPLQQSAESSQSKRLADDAYVLRCGRQDAWRLYRAPLMQRMRIGAPDVGWQQSRSDRADLRNRQDLFTSEEIPERTEFVADIVFEDTADARTLAERLSERMGDLKLGRGGRPVEVVRAIWIDRAAHVCADDVNEVVKDSLRIVLESDLILRGPNLGFVTQFDRPVLAALLQDAGLDADFVQSLSIESIADTTHISGFNASSGLPRAVQLGMRRGSTMRVTGSTEHLQQLHTALAGQKAWGERTHEGFGRLRSYGQDWTGAAAKETSAVRARGRQPHAEEAFAAETYKLLTSRNALPRWRFLVDLFAKLPKTAVYDFATLAKSNNKAFEKRFPAALLHYEKRTVSTESKDALAALEWVEEHAEDATVKRAAVKSRLYYLARWAIALGKYRRADADDDDVQAADDAKARVMEDQGHE